MLQCIARAHGAWASPARLEWYRNGQPARPATPVFSSKLAAGEFGEFWTHLGVYYWAVATGILTRCSAPRLYLGSSGVRPAQSETIRKLVTGVVAELDSVI